MTQYKLQLANNNYLQVLCTVLYSWIWFRCRVSINLYFYWLFTVYSFTCRILISDRIRYSIHTCQQLVSCTHFSLSTITLGFTLTIYSRGLANFLHLIPLFYYYRNGTLLLDMVSNMTIKSIIELYIIYSHLFSASVHGNLLSRQALDMRNKFHHSIEHYNRLVSTHMLDSIYTLTIYILFFIHMYWLLVGLMLWSPQNTYKRNTKLPSVLQSLSILWQSH